MCEKWTNVAKMLGTFIQRTTPATALISKLGERQLGPLDVREVLRTLEDGGDWTMTEQAPSRKSAQSKMDAEQADCFRRHDCE
jgi:hypothetical protein